MALESATYLDDLNATNPPGDDKVKQADDHLRLIKSTLKATFPSLSRAIYLEQGAEDLASATTPDLSTPTTAYINITGTTQIDGFASEPAGFMRLLRFNAALTLNYNVTSLILPTAADITTEAGDHALAVSLGSGNWRIAWYLRYSGRALTKEIPDIASTDVGLFLQAQDDSPQAYDWAQVFPAGIIMAWPTETPPSGWLECNGAAVSRTTYATLFALIGDDYGAGNGSTTFNLPDFRGEFLRGWDHGKGSDPDSADRTDRGDATTGDHVGTKQTDLFKLHGHPFRLSVSSNASNDTTGGFMTDTNGPTNVPAFTGTPSATSGEQIGGSGGDETRPRNVNVMYIIKAH